MLPKLETSVQRDQCQCETMFAVAHQIAMGCEMQSPNYVQSTVQSVLQSAAISWLVFDGCLEPYLSGKVPSPCVAESIFGDLAIQPCKARRELISICSCDFD